MPPVDQSSAFSCSSFPPNNTETKANEVTQTIHIILRGDRFEDIDLREVKEHWGE